MKKILYILVLITFILCIDRINAYTEYKIGDVVTYNDMNFYVIKDSSSDETSVTMLKAEPLTYEEVQQYSSGTGAQISNQNGYGGMQYHSGSSNYATSYIKKVVDKWANDNISLLDIAIDYTGYSARILSIDDLNDNLGYDIPSNMATALLLKLNEYVPNWVWNNDYNQWLMTHYPYWPTMPRLWIITQNGNLYWKQSDEYNTVRPVVTLKKNAFENDKIIDDDFIDKSDIKQDEKDNIANKTNEIEIDTKDNIVDNKNSETKTTVKVDNTYMSSSIIIIILGFIMASISIFIIYKLSNKKR